MLQGLTPEAKEKYGLLSADKYFYLNQVCHKTCHIIMGAENHAAGLPLHTLLLTLSDKKFCKEIS